MEKRKFRSKVDSWLLATTVLSVLTTVLVSFL